MRRTHAEGLDSDDRKTAEKDAATLQRVLAGVIPVLAEAEGLDLVEIDWQQFVRLRACRFGNLEHAS